MKTCEHRARALEESNIVPLECYPTLAILGLDVRAAVRDFCYALLARNNTSNSILTGGFVAGRLSGVTQIAQSGSEYVSRREACVVDAERRQRNVFYVP